MYRSQHCLDALTDSNYTTHNTSTDSCLQTFMLNNINKTKLFENMHNVSKAML